MRKKQTFYVKVKVYMDNGTVLTRRCIESGVFAFKNIEKIIDDANNVLKGTGIGAIRIGCTIFNLTKCTAVEIKYWRLR